MANEDPTIREYFENVATHKEWDHELSLVVLLDYINAVHSDAIDASDDAFKDFVDNYGKGPDEQ